jgi:hypothetical protein
MAEPKTASLSYEAVDSSTKRKNAPSGQRPHKDVVLFPAKRKKAETALTDVMENIPLAGWMVRRHLDAVSKFYVDVDSKVDKATRDRIEALFRWAGLAKNFDAARRHSVDEAFRLFELNKIIDGGNSVRRL